MRDENRERKDMEAIVREEIGAYAADRRHALCLTQEKMASALVLSTRAYSELERGRSAGVLTTVLLLLADEDPHRFLHAVRMRLERER